jgi:transcriptional regulator with XRE-family HTH domain
MELNIRKIERERKKLGLTKQKFAKHIGVVPSNYSYILRTKSTTLDRVERIAEALDVDAKDLLT